ncbi:LdpA C-terminal domain-containing domain [Alkalinema sp. FACHB-956]|uniref:circadian clock protein LdpA n=1 Tax=Alkalinema sp. FACHB-956 TaxID=2692768 RepID=UPI001688EAC8|nr:LdpA C-terminal domain-containing domain [Alkalinema sp. FACHB-956]MBD2326613.1 4Fe-4S ferredoxin [Alkalinema sp. FACHB-956]
MQFQRPRLSLETGQWVKLICGASYQHIPAIRSLAIVYSLAGVDCIDVAADPAIIATVREAIAIANTLVPKSQPNFHLPSYNGDATPWLMVSLNDGEDPHFRKAEFSSSACPADCPRPCEKVCPAEAIVFGSDYAGVIDALCYGCGRCLPICPIEQIHARSYVYAPEVIAPTVLQAGVDAVEIHTQVGRFEDFQRLWRSIKPQRDRLKLVAVSCPDGEDLIDYLWSLATLLQPALPPSCALVWQTDGRPMSGDIGDGATRACIQLGQKVLQAGLPGFVQLAGGTNRHTVEKLRSLGLLQAPRSSSDPQEGADPTAPADSTPPMQSGTSLARMATSTGVPSGIATGTTTGIATGIATGTVTDNLTAPTIAGVAYGSYARSILQPVLHQLEERGSTRLEEHPDLLWAGVTIAANLVSPLKKIAGCSLVNAHGLGNVT